MRFEGRTLFITGATRGIGRAIALRVARDGANVALASKTQEPHAKLPGTLDSVAAEIEAAGGKALPLVCDVRDEERVAQVVRQAAEHFGGIDLCVNNASAISLTPTLATPMKRFDLMFGVNVRATFCVSQACLPWLLKSDHARILNLGPPLDMQEKWFAPHLAYTMSKMGMSMCTLGLAGEFRGRVGVNSLWPRTTIATAAVEMLGGEALMRHSRNPEIMADAAHAILSRPVDFTGNCLLDEDVLAAEGVTDFDRYAVTPGAELQPDFFV